MSFREFLPKGVDIKTAKLGDVPHMFSLVPLAQSVNAPIFALSLADGLVGSQYRQVTEYAKILNALSKAIAKNIGIEI